MVGHLQTFIVHPLLTATSQPPGHYRYRHKRSPVLNIEAEVIGRSVTVTYTPVTVYLPTYLPPQYYSTSFFLDLIDDLHPILQYMTVNL
jgi:hypothetical protein